MSKVFVGAYVPYRLVVTKNITGYSHMHETLNMLMGAFCSLGDRIVMSQCSTSEKSVAFFGFFRLLPFPLFACVASDRLTWGIE